MIWLNLTNQPAHDVLGLIPSFVSEDDPRPAREQINEGYAHGGGWSRFDGFELDVPRLELTYPGDPPTRARAMSKLRDELLILFEHDWFVILQRDGTWEAARLD